MHEAIGHTDWTGVEPDQSPIAPLEAHTLRTDSAGSANAPRA